MKRSLGFDFDIFCQPGLGEGSVCSTAVENAPRDLEVVGSNPTECRTFFSPSVKCPLSGSLRWSSSSPDAKRYQTVQPGQNVLNKYGLVKKLALESKLRSARTETTPAGMQCGSGMSINANAQVPKGSTDI